MNEVAGKYAQRDIGSIFLYNNEAHPGENYPHLTSMEKKLEHACALRDVLGVTRPILVDALDGACHRAYGSMPNMTWIFNRAGLILYKSDWTDANSVENAILYSDRSPDITVTLTSDADKCTLDFADRGRGIEINEQKKIFNMFYRIRRKKENIRGTGLGLFIVHATVRRHHGQVKVESKGPGEGTTFRIILPTAQGEVAS